MTNKQTIYVELLDEGVVVYPAVEATPDPDGVLRLPATAPADERVQRLGGDWGGEPGDEGVEGFAPESLRWPIA